MTDFQKDLLTGLAFIIGLIGFMSGEFIIASALFAATATHLSRDKIKCSPHSPVS